MFADVHGGKGPPVRFGSAAKASIPPKSDPMARIHCVFRIAMCGTKPSQIVRPGSSRSPEGNCNGQQVGWDAKPRQRRALFPTCRALTGDSRNATRRRGFSLYRAWPYAVTQAGGRFELPAFLNTDRGRDSEMTSSSFNLGFIDATRISALRQEMHLGDEQARVERHDADH